MKHYLVTNRPLEKVDGVYQFVKEGNNISSVLHYGYLDLDADGSVRYEIIGHDDATEPIDFSYNTIKDNAEGVASFFKELYHDMRNENLNPDPNLKTKNDAMVFIHGYGHSVEKSFRFFKKLNQRYVDNPDCNVKKIVMFMWPSKAHGISYFREKKDAEYSGNILGDFYLRVNKFNEKYAAEYERTTQLANHGYLHLVVQSMGNKVLEKMVTHITESSTPFQQVFKEIVMVGADVENNVFEKDRSLEKLPSICSRIHVYVHKGDFALNISKLFNWIKAFPDRHPLGKTGPDNVNIISGSVKVVDVTRVEKFISHDNDDFNDFLDDNIIQHRYFMYSTEVINDITEVLNGLPSEKMRRDVKVEARWFTLPFTGVA